MAEASFPSEAVCTNLPESMGLNYAIKYVCCDNNVSALQGCLCYVQQFSAASTMDGRSGSNLTRQRNSCRSLGLIWIIFPSTVWHHRHTPFKQGHLQFHGRGIRKSGDALYGVWKEPLNGE